MGRIFGSGFNVGKGKKCTEYTQPVGYNLISHFVMTSLNPLISKGQELQYVPTLFGLILYLSIFQTAVCVRVESLLSQYELLDMFSRNALIDKYVNYLNKLSSNIDHIIGGFCSMKLSYLTNSK